MAAAAGATDVVTAEDAPNKQEQPAAPSPARKQVKPAEPSSAVYVMNEPASAYMRFCKERWPRTLPGAGFSQRMAALSSLWMSACAEEKQPFMDAYTADMEAYQSAPVWKPGAKCIHCKKRADADPFSLSWCDICDDYALEWAEGALEGMATGIASTGAAIPTPAAFIEDHMRSRDGNVWLCDLCRHDF